MDPISIAVVGTMAVSSLVNLYNAEKARGADRRRLKEIRQLFEKIKPPDYDVSIDAPPQYHEQALQSPKYADPLQAPKFDTSRLSPEDLKSVGKYIPEVAPYIAQAAPELIKQSQDALAARDVQRKALQKYMTMGETGDDAISAQASAMAAQQAGMDARSRSQAVLQDAQRRGQLGSGMQLAAQLQGNAYASNQEAMARMQAASDAQRRRLEALASGASLGGQIYNQDISLASRNADIINDFNRQMAQGRQNYEMQRAASLNDAQRFNLQMQQELANRNVAARNEAQRQNLGRSDDLTRYQSQFAQGQQQRADRLAQSDYENQRYERDYRNRLAESKAQWAAQQRANYNKMLGQQYDDQMRWASGMAGMGNTERQAAREYAQDRAQAVQGLANAGMSGLDYYNKDRQWQRQQTAADDRAMMESQGRWMTDDERRRRKAYYE